MKLRLLFVAILSAASFAFADLPDPIALWQEFQQLGAKELWPNFDPRATPVIIFDGKQTFLLGHPAPPPEFKELPDRKGIRVYEGQHQAARANNQADIAGIPTATI